MATLAIDVGTTAVKAAIVSLELRVLASSTMPTDAYVAASCGAKHQSVPAIARALNSAISSLDAELLASATRIAIADQMHGAVLWGDTREHEQVDALHASHLVTWEDRACPVELLAAMNRHLLAAAPSCQYAPVHHGFGLATLAAAVVGTPSAVEALAGQPLATFAHAGTIGAFLAHQLCANPSLTPSKPVIDPTDAASWGGFDVEKGCFAVEETAAAAAAALPRMQPPPDGCPSALPGSGCSEPLVAALAADLRRLVPQVVPAGSPAGVLVPAACTRIGLHALATAFRSVSSPPVVHVSVGDHPASVAGAMHALLEAGGRSDGPVVFLNAGTSMQAAIVLPAEEVPGALNAGCEVRPFPRIPTLAASAGEQRLLLAASLNGGNVLAGLAASWARGGSVLGQATSRPPGTLDGAYVELEELAVEALDAHAAAIVWPAEGEAVDASSCHAPQIGGVRFKPIVVPERTILISGCGVASSVDDATSTRAAASALDIADLPPRDAGLRYAAAALGLLHNVCSMLPSSVWLRPAVARHTAVATTLPDSATASDVTVVLTGSAFAKSRTLRRCADLFLRHLVGEASSSRPSRLVELPGEATASAGAVGAALIAASSAFGPAAAAS